MEDLIEACGPGVFTVGGAGDAAVLKVVVEMPATTLELADEEIGVADVSGAFFEAHVEPYAEVLAMVGLEDGQDGAMVPPEGGG